LLCEIDPGAISVFSLDNFCPSDVKNMVKPRFRIQRLLLGLGLLVSCLPPDGRPEPGTARFIVSGGPNLVAGQPIVTQDGWSIRITKFLVSLQSVYVNPPDTSAEVKRCEVYVPQEPGQVTLFDLSLPRSFVMSEWLIFGPCDVYFSGFIRFFGSRSLRRGDGVTEQDSKILQPRDDTPVGVVSREEVNQPPGALDSNENAVRDSRRRADFAPVIYVVGEATKVEQRQRFAWKLAKTQNEYALGCTLNQTYPLVVRSNATVPVSIEITPESLFLDSIDESVGTLRFEPMALADRQGDNDGVVTKQELQTLELSSLRATGDASYTLQGVSSEARALASQPVSLWDYLEDVLTSRLIRWQGQPHCTLPKKL